jgi:NADH:ubiquinone oxidoreductase subunit K
MYQSYPQGGGVPPETGRPTPPRAVQRAVLLMYIGAALDVVSLIVVLLSFHVIENAIRKGATTAAHPLTAHQIHDLALFIVAIAVVESAIAVGLWLLMAWANKNGQNWGRITATVLFGLNTIFLLISFARPQGVLSLLAMLLVWLVGLGAIILLWRRETTDYIAARRTRR